jgi:PD-(D/E)XK endonuclease
VLTPRQQGDIGELSAISWLAGRGIPTLMPLVHSPNYDLVADLDGRLVRIEVKTSTVFRRGRWEVTVCTRGGNRSWDGLAKRLDPLLCDFLFVLVGDGRRWLIPADSFGGGTEMRLGGPKYARFEVERGDPIPRRASVPNASTIDPPATRGDVRAAKGEAL